MMCIGLQCQWSGAPGKVLFQWGWRVVFPWHCLYSHQTLGYDQQVSLNWDPGKLLESMDDRLEHKTLSSWSHEHETPRDQKVVY